MPISGPEPTIPALKYPDYQRTARLKEVMEEEEEEEEEEEDLYKEDDEVVVGPRPPVVGVTSLDGAAYWNCSVSEANGDDLRWRNGFTVALN